jgi:hypothetical protein
LVLSIYVLYFLTLPDEDFVKFMAEKLKKLKTIESNFKIPREVSVLKLLLSAFIKSLKTRKLSYYR